jgi:protein TonB
MSNAARHALSAVPAAEEEPAPVFQRTQKHWIYLVSLDDALWPQVSEGLDPQLTLKQVDSPDELLSSAPANQAAVVVWDARASAAPTDVLAHLQRHSSQFAVVALDDADNTEAWRLPAQQRQIVALVGLPLKAAQLSAAIAKAREDLLGRSSAPLEEPPVAEPQIEPAPPRRRPYGLIGAAALLIACAVGYLLLRPSAPSVAPEASHAPGAASTPATGAVTATAEAAKQAASDAQIDALLDKARQAMVDRHFIDPANGNALAYYQDVLIYDPANGEARQGIQRLAQILVSRVQSDLDEQKYDLALQALETARTINPGDPALTDLDTRIATLRSELGPAQILAAINAKNFDRAAQLLDDAGRAKSLSAGKLAQLREELRQHREESDASHFVKLIDTRLQQDHLLLPERDSAAFYLQQARDAGVTASDLQPQIQEFIKKLLLAARVALDQRRLADAERMINEARNENVAPALIAGLQRDLAAARDQQAHDRAAQAQMLDAAQARLAQGNVLEPDGDSAFFYVNQLRATDPKYDGLASTAAAVRTEIVARARAALEAGDPSKAAAFAAAASQLGNSTDLDALNDKIAQAQLNHKPPASGSKPTTVSANTLQMLKPLRPDYPPAALERGTEGWVDLSFVVTVDGKVADVSVIDSNPKKIFDLAASNAVYRVRYKPVLKDGKPISVSTGLRVVFKVSN